DVALVGRALDVGEVGVVRLIQFFLGGGLNEIHHESGHLSTGCGATRVERGVRRARSDAIRSYTVDVGRMRPTLGVAKGVLRSVLTDFLYASERSRGGQQAQDHGPGCCGHENSLKTRETHTL